MTTPSDKQTDNQPALQPPELLPCRFCGRKALIEEFRDGDDPQPLFVAACEVCPVKTYDQFTAQEAARIWNTRAAVGAATVQIPEGQWQHVGIKAGNPCVVAIKFETPEQATAFINQFAATDYIPDTRARVDGVVATMDEQITPAMVVEALRTMVQLWDDNHPDDPCGCVGASDDCRFPPPCELCCAREALRSVATGSGDVVETLTLSEVEELAEVLEGSSPVFRERILSVARAATAPIAARRFTVPVAQPVHQKNTNSM